MATVRLSHGEFGALKNGRMTRRREGGDYSHLKERTEISRIESGWKSAYNVGSQDP